MCFMSICLLYLKDMFYVSLIILSLSLSLYKDVCIVILVPFGASGLLTSAYGQMQIAILANSSAFFMFINVHCSCLNKHYNKINK